MGGDFPGLGSEELKVYIFSIGWFSEGRQSNWDSKTYFLYESQ